MKTRLLVSLITLTVLASANLHAGSVSKEVKQALKGPSVEWAPSAARLVASTPVEDKQAVAKDLIITIGKKQPSLVPTLVGEMAKAEKSLAAFFAREGALVTPEFSVDIARAAASSAPESAEKIAAEVAIVFSDAEATAQSPKVPASQKKSAVRDIRIAAANDIYLSLSEQVPARESQILAAVGTSVPEFRMASVSSFQGNAGSKIGVGNGKGKGGENGIGVGNNEDKPKPGNGKGLGHGKGNGKGRGTVNGRGVINAYHRVNP